MSGTDLIKLVLVIIQIALLFLQFGCMWYERKHGLTSMDVLNGYTMWAPIPIVGIMAVILMLPD